MKVRRIVLTVIDFDNMGMNEVVSVLENTSYPNHCISPRVISIEEREIDKWRDDHPLNFSHTADAEIERLFGTS